MGLRKKECLQQNIKKNSGQIGWSVGVFSVLFLAVFLCALQEIELYRATSLYLEDALAASNLASAVVDLQEYGMTHNILIEDSGAAYERYRWAVKENLNLTDGWESREGGVVKGVVQIINYTVYNVKENEVLVYCYDRNGLLTTWSTPPGGAVAPNGVTIASTSVYSEIAFTVKGMLGIEVQAHKGNLADIAK